jgi:hypothetical protein
VGVPLKLTAPAGQTSSAAVRSGAPTELIGPTWRIVGLVVHGTERPYVNTQAFLRFGSEGLTGSTGCVHDLSAPVRSRDGLLLIGKLSHGEVVPCPSRLSEEDATARAVLDHRRVTYVVVEDGDGVRTLLLSANDTSIRLRVM